MKSINDLKAEQEKLSKSTSALEAIPIAMILVCVYGTVENGVGVYDAFAHFLQPHTSH